MGRIFKREFNSTLTVLLSDSKCVEFLVSGKKQKEYIKEIDNTGAF